VWFQKISVITPRKVFGSSNGEGSLEFPDRCGVYNQKILP